MQPPDVVEVHLRDIHGGGAIVHVARERRMPVLRGALVLLQKTVGPPTLVPEILAVQQVRESALVEVIVAERLWENHRTHGALASHSGNFAN